MNYAQKHNYLRKAFYEKNGFFCSDEECMFFRESFTSESECKDVSAFSNENENYNLLLSYFLKNNEYSKKYIFRDLNAPDNTFSENRRFNYYVLDKKERSNSDSAILLLHGLNERHWDKYLTWAEALFAKTGKPVILFPLAFHMERAPLEWSDPRIMHKVSLERSKLIPDVRNSSFANAALSTRLQFQPERFLLSGIQTYHDLVNLIKIIKQGKHESFAHGAKVDLFGYSIGAFLGQILLMSNPENLLADTRLFMFCGGSFIDKTEPVSKAIIDSSAANAVLRYYSREFADHSEKNSLLKLLGSFEDIGLYFKSLINSAFYPSLSNSLLRSIKEKIKVVGMQTDRVFSPASLYETFPGQLTNLIDIIKPVYKNSHEKPFPENQRYSGAVDIMFNRVFTEAGAFLS